MSPSRSMWRGCPRPPKPSATTTHVRTADSGRGAPRLVLFETWDSAPSRGLAISQKIAAAPTSADATGGRPAQSNHAPDATLRRQRPTRPLDQNKRKLSEQEPRVECGPIAQRRGASMMYARAHFSVKFKCGIWAALTVPVKRSIILGGRFVVELRLVSEHWEASRDCVCALPPME